MNNWQFNIDCEELAPQEGKSVAIIASGASNKQGARALGISPSTFTKNLQRAMYKLNTYNRTETVAVAIRKGIITALCLCLLIQAFMPVHKSKQFTRTVRTHRNARREATL